MARHATMMDSFGAGYAAAIADVHRALSNMRYARGNGIIATDEQAANEFFGRELQHLQSKRFADMAMLEQLRVVDRGGA